MTTALLVATLRRRAAMLEDEANGLLREQSAGQQILRSKVRSPEHLLIIAAEFTWLANAAEGYEPQA